MKKVMSSLLISLFISCVAWSKSLDQKQEELNKIYEAGGIIGIIKSEHNKKNNSEIELILKKNNYKKKDS